MNESTNSLNWFEIPVVDIERAQKFYEAVFEISMFKLPIPEFEMVAFPSEPGNGKASGALMKHEMYQPSSDSGVVIYLNADPDIQRVIDRIAPAGGQILIPKTQITEEIGYMAFFLDTEGNRLALHARA